MGSACSSRNANLCAFVCVVVANEIFVTATEAKFPSPLLDLTGIGAQILFLRAILELS